MPVEYTQTRTPSRLAFSNRSAPTRAVSSGAVASFTACATTIALLYTCVPIPKAALTAGPNSLLSTSATPALLNSPPSDPISKNAENENISRMRRRSNQ